MQLHTMPLRSEQDVVSCRQVARVVAEALRFAGQDRVRVATAVSEIARNAVCYARDAAAEFSLENRGPVRLVCTITDRGPGIAQLDAILAGAYRSASGLGQGIISAKMLMDAADVTTSPDGTTVRLVKTLPAGERPSPSQIQGLIERLVREVASASLHVEVAVQNRELSRLLAEMRQQNEEIGKINEELSETNRGVVALYDELDTIYRVSRVVATKLDLPALFQAITDATTEISGAEFAAFYLRVNPESPLAVRQSMAGPLRAMLEPHETTDLTRLLGSVDLRTDVYRVDDLETASDTVPPFAGMTAVRSYLAVPVNEPDQPLAGCLVFGHRQPGAFTERSERILASVAVQASIGLENARLYHSIQSANAAKDQFLAVLSHELRTPLNPVFAVLASLEQRQDLAEEVRGDLLIMRRNLQLEARLIDDLLDLTRIVKGKVPLQLEVLDVHSLIRLACETCAAAITAQEVRLRLELDAPHFFVHGDAARLQQVFWNLLSNAVKFTPRGGTVVVSTAVDAGVLTVRVTDTGKGINPEVLTKIFQPFEQGDAAVPAQYGGLGLGLAISRSIVDAHRGTIRAESAGPGRGATFAVTLPSTAAPETPARAIGGSAKAPAGTRGRILLVDDHADTRVSLQRLLARRGHQVTVAATCREAEEQAAGHAFDLVISDLGLPDGTGHDLMRVLRAAHGLTGIALSGYGMEADIQRSHDAGFAAHLTKPLDFTVLEATIEKALASV